MSRMPVDDLFYGRPERVQFVAGGGGGYGGLYSAGPHYYSDGEDYYSHRHSGRDVYASSRPMLPDVQLSVPMDSARCVEKVKEALDVNGVYGVHCDVPNQTVTVSGNLPPQTLLKKVKHVKRKAKILSYTSGFTNSGHVAPRHRRTSSAYGAPAYGSSSYTSSYYNAGRLPSPPRDYAYHGRHNQHALARPGPAVYHSQYRPSQDYNYANY